ncbi:hypothetical protein EBX31_04080 [bacterium]|nr:hypothetical protein [bacterium]
MFLTMKIRCLILGLFFPWVAFAQSADDLSGLPSTKPEQKIPGLDEAEPKISLPEGYNANDSSISIPKLRPSVEEEEKKNKNQDWAAQAMQEKQEAAKKKQLEETSRDEAKAHEIMMQEQKKTAKKGVEGDPAISRSSTDALVESDKAKLTAVPGIEGVKPRATDSGDGRVQPTFDSFTGPSASGPMGKDYQSGAKPIMPSSSAVDGRIMVPPKAPEPPSGAYKKISQDPYALPARNETAKPVQQTKPKLDGKNPPAGNPLTPGAPAGYSPYDNNRIVPDPRSTRKF